MEYYQCTKCELWCTAREFYFSKGKRNPWCKECYRAWHRARYTPKSGGDDEPRICVQCGVSYRPKQRRPSIYCDRRCKDDASNARVAAELMASKTERVCLYCANIIPQEARKDKVFCTARCNEKAHTLQRKLRLRTGSDDKPGYLRAEICTRDGWRCGICRRFVDKTLEYPDLLCASLDHIIPVSRNGNNDPTNLRLTHLICNLRRGNTPIEEVVSMVL